MRQTGSPQSPGSPRNPPTSSPPQPASFALSGVPVALQGEEEQRVNSGALALLRESVRK